MHCAICRTAIEPGEGMQLGALGKQLFHAHRTPCAAGVLAVVNLTTAFALKSAHGILLQRAPLVTSTIEKVYAQLKA